MTDQPTTAQHDAPRQALSNTPGSARRRNGALPLAMAVMAASGGAWDIGPAMGFARNRHSSYAERHDPNREKTAEDLERMEAARLKRERKAAKKLSLQNIEMNHRPKD